MEQIVHNLVLEKLWHWHTIYSTFFQNPKFVESESNQFDNFDKSESVLVVS